MSQIPPITQNFTIERLSVVISKLILFCFFAIFAVFTIFTTIAQTIEIPFSSFSVIGIILIIITLIMSIFIGYRYVNKDELIFDYTTLNILTLIIVISTIIGTIALQHNEDDFYYVGNIVYYLEYPSQEVDYYVHYFVEDPNPLKVYGVGVSVAYEYFQGIIAYIFQIDFLFIYYQLAPAFAGFILPIALYFALSSFSDSSYACLTGVVFILVVLLILFESEGAFASNAYIRFKHGKAIAATIGLPTLIGFSIYFLFNRTWFAWLAIFCVFTSITGLSQSMMIMASSMSVGLFFGYILLYPLNLLNFVRVGFHYVSSQIYVFAYALFLLTQTELELGVSSPINFGRYPTTFEGHFKYITYPSLSAPTFMMVSTSIILFFLIVRGKWQKRFIIVWMITVITFFLNPIVATPLIKYVTSPNIYWRMFYIFPFPLIVGILGIQLYHLLPSKHKNLLAVFISGGAFAIAVLVFDANGYIRWEQYKYRQYRVNYAQEIMKVAPEGPILAPNAIGNTLPIFSANYPQIAIKGKNTLLFLRSQEEAQLREDVTHYVTYGGEHEILDKYLKSNQPTSIVITVEAVGNKHARDILANYGYSKFKRLDDIYFVYWQPTE